MFGCSLVSNEVAFVAWLSIGQHIIYRLPVGLNS